VLHDFAMTWPQVAMMTLRMHWTKQLAYTITPKSGPMRRMETLLDANRALSNDLPRELFKPAFPGSRTDFPNARSDSYIGVSSLCWIERGGHGAPDG
jgi:hypothetical protein